MARREGSPHRHLPGAAGICVGAEDATVALVDDVPGREFDITEPDGD
ncbi:hypothetical protein ACGF5O_44985 [Streptomyces sp. NPDC048291]